MRSIRRNDSLALWGRIHNISIFQVKIYHKDSLVINNKILNLDLVK